MDSKRFMVITNRKLCRPGEFLSQLDKVLSLHPDSLLLREKDLSVNEYESLAVNVNLLCQRYSVKLFVHSNIGLAKRLGIMMVHLPYGEFEKSGRIYGYENLSGLKYISVVCHSLEEVRRVSEFAVKKKAEGSLNSPRIRIILGTIFETDCKPGLAGAGVEFVKRAKEVVCEIDKSVEIFAIGGICPDNIDLVLEAGADGGCMMSIFMRMEFSSQH